MKKSLFRYFGGKYLLAPKLISLFPRHTCYVEVFGGAGNVLFQKPSSKVEIFNDINSDIFGLFRVLQSDYEKFVEALRFIPYSREEHREMKAQLKTETCEFRRAVLWFVVQHMSFSGISSASHFSTDKHWNKARNWQSVKETLHFFCKRIQNVVLENKDFSDILDIYDGSETFFYLDPPYVPEMRKGSAYEHEISLDDHERLIDCLLGLKMSR